MKRVWVVSGGEYSGYYVSAVCSSYEQACGVAVREGLDAEETPIELWEEGDEIPPYKMIHTCLVRNGPDSTRPIDVTHYSSPVALDAQTPEPEVRQAPMDNLSGWVRAENYPTAEEAEMAARSAYEARVSLR